MSRKIFTFLLLLMLIGCSGNDSTESENPLLDTHWKLKSLKQSVNTDVELATECQLALSTLTFHDHTVTDLQAQEIEEGCETYTKQSDYKIKNGLLMLETSNENKFMCLEMTFDGNLLKTKTLYYDRNGEIEDVNEFNQFQSVYEKIN